MKFLALVLSLSTSVFCTKRSASLSSDAKTNTKEPSKSIEHYKELVDQAFEPSVVFRVINKLPITTFEEELSVDISAVTKELKSLETEMKTTDETIAEYCRELNIPTPF